MQRFNRESEITMPSDESIKLLLEYRAIVPVLGEEIIDDHGSAVRWCITTAIAVFGALNSIFGLFSD